MTTSSPDKGKDFGTLSPNDDEEAERILASLPELPTTGTTAIFIKRNRAAGSKDQVDEAKTGSPTEV